MARNAAPDDTSNPLLKDFEFPPYASVETEHIVPGVRALLKQLEADLNTLETTLEPSWPKLVEPFERLVDRLQIVWGIINHLNSVKYTPELLDAIQQVQPQKVCFDLRLAQSKPIYNAFKAIKESSQWQSLIDAKKHVVDSRIKEAILNGVALGDDKREEFNKIEQKLQCLSLKFEENVLNATKKFEKLITNKSELQGLPDVELFLAAKRAKSKRHNATAEHGPWLISLDARSFNSVMQHAQNRDLREEIYHAYVAHASSDILDNTPIIREILKLRLEKAKLLNIRTMLR
ncbi:Zincin-like metalloproteases family protein [Euphorbia peplus]|nr:Zincin-like metalloproteases family protein [Euphorbia peplus]